MLIGRNFRCKQYLKELFANYGEVKSAEVSMDAFTERSRGFGFVEMPNEAEAQNAIVSLNNTNQHNRVISVKAVNPKENHKGSYKVGNGSVWTYRFKKSR